MEMDISASERRGLAAAFATAALACLVWAFPDMTRFVSIPAALLFVGLTIWFLWPELKAATGWLKSKYLGKKVSPTDEKNGRRSLLFLGVTCGAIAAAIVVLFLTYYHARHLKLPGFAAYAVLRVYDTPESRRKYVFDMGSAHSKARAAFYLSASDQFTFLITDANGELYPLEVKLGQDGIPIDRHIMLTCEAGGEGDATVLRVSVNGKEIQQRRIPFAIDLGDRKWGAGSVLGGGTFVLGEFGAYSETFSKDETEKLTKNVADFYKLK